MGTNTQTSLPIAAAICKGPVLAAISPSYNEIKNISSHDVYLLLCMKDSVYSPPFFRSA